MWSAIICAVIIVSVAGHANSSTVILDSSLSSGQQPCPEDELVFTCMTVGSPILTWQSPEYIGGDGVYFQFVPFHERGERRISRKDNSTFAVLVEIDGQVLRSELHLIVSEKYANPTISCIGISNGTDGDDNKTASFSVSSNTLSVPSVVVLGKQCALEITLPNELPGTPGFDHFDIQVRSDGSLIMLNKSDTNIAIPYTVRNLNVNYHINVSTVNRCGQHGPLTVVPTFSADTTRCCIGEDCGSRQEKKDNDSISFPKATFITLIAVLGSTTLISMVGCSILGAACICMMRHSKRRYQLENGSWWSLCCQCQCNSPYPESDDDDRMSRASSNPTPQDTPQAKNTQV